MRKPAPDCCIVKRPIAPPAPKRPLFPFLRPKQSPAKPVRPAR